MSRDNRKNSDYDDFDYFSDYDNYFGGGSRSNGRRRGGYDRRSENNGRGYYDSRSGESRPRSYDSRSGGSSRRSYDSRSGQNRRDSYSRRPSYDNGEEYGGSNRIRGYHYSDLDDYEENRFSQSDSVGSGMMYLLMFVFFAVVASSVIFGKVYVNHSMDMDLTSDSAYIMSSENEPSSEPEPVDPAVQKVEEALGNMTLQQKVGQLFMVRNNGSGSFSDTVYRTGAGGAILFWDDFKRKNADEVRAMISELQSSSDEKMIIAVDEEGGTVVRVSRNPKLRSSKFLSPQNLYSKGGFDLIVSDTEEKCELLYSLGINMNMAPVADVCTSLSGFLYKRSFGKGPEETAEYVSKVVGVMKEPSVASCVKHFPGYGNSKADTHKGLDVNEKSLEDLRECDLVPFRAAIRDGTDGIMLTHTVIQSVDPDRPASLSPEVVNLIRGELGFDGVIITDALDMGALIEFSEGDTGKACVMAVNAGVDILCAPKNPLSDYNAVLEAASSGEIDQSRIDESVRRIIRLKMRLGLYP